MVLLKTDLLEIIIYPVANRVFPFTIIAKASTTAILAAALTASPIGGFLKPLGIKGPRRAYSGRRLGICSKTQRGMDVASRANRKRRKVKQQQPDSPSEDEISDN
ncbi:hypothetical protein PpBr36_02310 [Pyricularia pennisetigena]|uniref:hypothetical protein n=1 Tax=Pyricularia pennisetigena TaxID=1578925 RepID=UPI00114F7951|nr:hypothetical protein PpBr36_02310 [Pyricularia pennisetigena]TLS31206.1 hypothetical protein PpBr36_02310 [Pyricularia pennisetigena]